MFYKQHCFTFFDQQTEKVKSKIDYVLFVLTRAERVPEKFLKHVEGTKGLYEVRVEIGNDIFRIFCCFDKGQIIVLFNDFRKSHKKHLYRKSILR